MLGSVTGMHHVIIETCDTQKATLPGPTRRERMTSLVPTNTRFTLYVQSRQRSAPHEMSGWEHAGMVVNTQPVSHMDTPKRKEAHCDSIKHRNLEITFFLVFVFWGHARQRSGVTPGSELRNRS